MAYKISVFLTLIALLSVIVSEATNLQDEWVCPALSYWKHNLPNTSIPNALREVICSQKTADHLFLKNIQDDVKGGDVTLYNYKHIIDRNPNQAMDRKPPSHGGDVTIYNHKYIIERNPSSHGGDVTIYNHKYIMDRNPSYQGGDVTIYNHKYITPERGDVTIYNHKYIIDKDPNQENVEYHRQLMVANPLLSIFFFEKDLHIGTNVVVDLEILKTQDSAHFLPRSIANVIPFSLEKLPVALDVLKIPQGSHMSAAMEEALKKCESPSISGETQYCATSLESMIDYATSQLGSNHLNVLVTDLPYNFNSRNQQYSITTISVKSKSSSKHVVCHSLIYPYAVYMCHEAKSTKIVELSLQGQGKFGSKLVPVAAICHADTSNWNPEHAAFIALNVKPGGEAICHFVLEGSIVWLPAN